MIERPPFRLAVRVYWEDTDAGGIVYYANYLKFFERARTEWLRTLGVQQQAMRETLGLVFVVSELQLRLLRPSRLDDLLEVGAELREAGQASMRLGQQVWRGAELVAEAEVRIGCVDAASLRPRRIPSTLLQALRP
jgi:acyl-CoA thioester hydrolase